MEETTLIEADEPEAEEPEAEEPEAEGPEAEEPEDEDELSESMRKLTREERIVVKALLAGKTVRAAGKMIRKCKRTVQYWIQKPTVRQALREGRDALLKEASTLLHSQTSWAVRTLRELALDRELTGMARVVAARSVVELAYKTAVADQQGDQLAEIREELAAIRREAEEEASGESGEPASGEPELQIAE